MTGKRRPKSTRSRSNAIGGGRDTPDTGVTGVAGATAGSDIGRVLTHTDIRAATTTAAGNSPKSPFSKSRSGEVFAATAPTRPLFHAPHASQALAATSPAAMITRAFSDPMEERQCFRESGKDARDGRSSGSRGSGSGGRVFSSLGRRKSIGVQGGNGSVGGLSSTTPGKIQSFQDQFGSGDCGVWSAINTAPPRSTSGVFFGEDTSDGGQGSDSSNEEDGDGPPSRRSYIRVACTARTSYKLFSSDPQVRRCSSVRVWDTSFSMY